MKRTESPSSLRRDWNSFEDRRLDGHVQRRNGLVGDQDLGSHRQGSGDRDPLPLPPENWLG